MDIKIDSVIDFLDYVNVCYSYNNKGEQSLQLTL